MGNFSQQPLCVLTLARLPSSPKGTASMGAVKKFPYPKYVWSPAGGWWCNPRNWKRNTVLAAAINFAIMAPIAYISWQLERRPVAPYRHIPSQRFAKHAKIDDPSLP